MLKFARATHRLKHKQPSIDWIKSVNFWSAMQVLHSKNLRCFLSHQGESDFICHLPFVNIIKCFRRPLGPPELVTPLLSLSALSSSLLTAPTQSPNTLNTSDIEHFIQDLANRFEPDNEIDEILGPVIRSLLFHESLFRPEGLGGGDASWRGVIGGLELLVSIKSIAMMITRMPEWNPSDATPPMFEKVSLLGPLCRLGVFSREWVCASSCKIFDILTLLQPVITQTYFSEPDKRSRTDIESSFASLRGTMKSLQVWPHSSSTLLYWHRL